ncbi:MAG: fumarylacetoacetate hydrolase family protein [Lautropia sp.]
MKLATFRWGGRRHAGLVDEDRRSVTPLAFGEHGERRGALAAIESLAQGRPLPRPSGPRLPLSAIELEAPIPVPRRNIFCIGLNYRPHAAEYRANVADASLAAQASEVPEHPMVFTKFPENVIGPGAAIRIPRELSTRIDYEAELAVVIGRGGRAIPAGRALEHVWGYTIVNDVTARDLQVRHRQWLLGKALDTFCPMGPWLVSADAVDGLATRIRCWVNGELRQDANTAELLFPVPKLIETISAGLTLQPGDVIATGTPAGVGIGFVPPRFLAPGDRVRIVIDGVGELENPVV